MILGYHNEPQFSIDSHGFIERFFYGRVEIKPMRFFVHDETKSKNIPLLLRNAGYHPETNRKTGQLSYIRSASGGDFPRFHIYVDEDDRGWSINLHLDQKAPSYRGTSAHGGEYEGSVVTEEMRRIQKFVME